MSAQPVRPAFRAARLWPLLPALIALLVYRLTLAPDLTWGHNGADGGDLLTAALTGGVPHPSGYPTYLLLLRAWLALLGGTPAFAGNLFSAVAAAGAILGIAVTSAFVLERLSCPLPTARLIAAATALLLAFSPTLWSQAVITEVYGLHALFATLLIYVTIRLGESHPIGGLQGLIAGLVLGIGLGNHLSLLLLIPGSIAYLWLARARFSRRGVGGIIAGCVLGLLVYLYLPWAARSDPPINWGDPRDLSRLWWLVSGRVYQPLVFAFPLQWLPWRLSSWASLLLQNLSFPGLALALLGLWHAGEVRRDLQSMILLHGGIISIYALGYDTADSYVYLIPAYLALAPAVALGAWVFGKEALRWSAAHRPAWRRGIPILLTLAFLALPFAQAWRYWEAEDLSRDTEAASFGKEALATADSDALLVASSDAVTFALWYYRYGLGMRPDVAILNPRLYAFDWYQRTVSHWHPDVVLIGDRATPPDFETLLEENMRVRPVYLAELLAFPQTRYNVVVKGPIYRLYLPGSQ